MRILSWPTPSDEDESAACAEMDQVLFFGPDEDEYVEPVDQRQWRERRAKEVCAQCPIRTQCLAEELALPAIDQHGLRGGKTAGQRRRLLRKWRKEGRIAARRTTADRALIAELLNDDEAA